ncbi:MAG: HEAT repeat domain-containing protein [Myxococcales bacterium]|nr:HEAT repeat domain-containing protein [Myxococcales bacterium]
MRTHFQIVAVTTLCITLLLSASSCKQLDEVLNNEEMQEFHRKGMESGSGLKVGAENQTKDVVVGQEPKLPDPFAPSGKGETYDLIAKRVRCGTDPRCTRDTTKALRELGRRAGPGLISLLGNEAPNDMRIEAIRVSGWLQETTAIEPLKELLTSPQGAIQREAAWALGLIGDPKAIDALAEILGGQNRLELTEAVYQALGGFNDEKAVQVLAEALPKVTPDLRATIVSSLGRTRHPAAVKPLSDVLRDPGELVRVEAVNALASVGGDDAIAALEQAATTDSSETVKKQALDAVKDLKTPRM